MFWLETQDNSKRTQTQHPQLRQTFRDCYSDSDVVGLIELPDKPLTTLQAYKNKNIYFSGLVSCRRELGATRRLLVAFMWNCHSSS
jgi:hypothetical protein